MRETPQFKLIVLININVIISYSMKIFSSVKKLLIILNLFIILSKMKIFYYKYREWGQLAWENFSHQRLYTESLNTNYIKNNYLHDHSKSVNRFKYYENKENFYQWLVGFTDGDGCFCISKSSKVNSRLSWNLRFKISQSSYNLRALYYIKRELGVGTISIDTKYNMAHFVISNRNIINSVIIPIFDKYPLLTSKQFSFQKLKKAYLILTNSTLSKEEKDNLLIILINESIPLNYISPVWKKISYKIDNTFEAKSVMSKYWLIGFVEAEGSFYLVSKSPTRIVHAFEVTQKLDLLVTTSIAKILGITVKKKKLYNTVVTTNSRAILNIVNYFEKTMKGMKALEFRIWSRSYFKNKGNYYALLKIREKLRNIRSIRLDNNGKIIQK